MIEQQQKKRMAISRHGQCKKGLTPNPTWSKIADLVENSNNYQSQTIKWQSKNRRKLYKQALTGQIQGHQYNSLLIKNQKIRERTELEQQVREQVKRKKEQKNKKIKTEQKYQTQNQRLANHHNRLINQKSEDDERRQQQNPFTKLANQQDQRIKQSKNGFKLQNFLNDIQIKAHQKRRKVDAQQDKVMRQQFESFIEKHYNQMDNQRLKFKNKYFCIKNSESPAKNSRKLTEKDTHSLFPTISSQQVQKQQRCEIPVEKKYIRFLEQQIQYSKMKNSKQTIQGLGQQQYKINKNIGKNYNYSPAFLGRLPASHDRMKQLGMVDFSLKNQIEKQKYMNNLNSQSQINEDSLVKKKDKYMKKMQIDSNMYKSLQINSQQTKQRANGQIQSQKPQSNSKAYPVILPSSLSLSTENDKMQKLISSEKSQDRNQYNPKKLDQKIRYNSDKAVKAGEARLQPKQMIIKSIADKNSEQRRKFMRYDIITGQHKDIIV